MTALPKSKQTEKRENKDEERKHPQLDRHALKQVQVHVNNSQS